MMRAEKLPVSAPEQTPARALPAAGGAPAVLALQRTAGNAAVTARLSRTPAFDPKPVVATLRQAIDQVKVSDKWTMEHGILGGMHATARHIDAAAVIGALDGLTPEQIALVKIRYQAQSITTLENDLFGLGRSGTAAGLTEGEAERIRALLRGTAQGLGEPPPPARLDALAAELHELAAGELKDAQMERLMALYRAHGTEMEPAYEQRYGHPPAEDLRGKLSARQLLRLDALRAGDVAQADAHALEDKRAAIAELDRRHDRGGLGLVEGWYEHKRADLAGEATEIATHGAREAMAEHPELPAAQAAQDRLAGGPQAVDGAGAVAALSEGRMIEALARRLLDLEARHQTDTEHVQGLLHELHELAVHDALAGLPAAQRAALAHDHAGRDALVAPTAQRYVGTFTVFYDGLRPSGGRSWAAIVASAKQPELLEATVAAGGKLDAVDELHFAIERKDAAAIRRVLDLHGSFAQMVELNATYLGRYHLDLRHAVFGATGVTVALEPKSALLPSASAVRGHDAATVLEALDTPPANGEAEVKWIVESAEREFKAVEAARGLAGAVWTPETENSMKISLALVRQLAAQWGTDRSEATLNELRGARAALRIDATGYESDLERFRAQVRSAVGFAVQTALAMMPGVGEGIAGFIATSVVNTSANVLANLVIQGDGYDLDMLYDDVVGGLAGAVGGKLGHETAGLMSGKKAAEELLELTAKQITGETAERAIALAKAAGRTSKLVEQAGRAAKMAEAGRALLPHALGVGGSTIATGLATGHAPTGETWLQGFGFAALGHAVAHPEANVVTDETMKAGDAKVEYTAERPGEVDDVHVRVGPGTDARVVAEHQAAARAVQRFKGLSGVLNRLYAQAHAFVTGHPAALPGTRAFEVRRELEKLQGGVAERLRAIAGGAGDEAAMAEQIKSYAEQLDHYREELAEIEKHPERGLERGRGWIAALSPGSFASYLEQRFAQELAGPAGQPYRERLEEIHGDEQAAVAAGDQAAQESAFTRLEALNTELENVRLGELRTTSGLPDAVLRELLLLANDNRPLVEQLLVDGGHDPARIRPLLEYCAGDQPTLERMREGATNFRAPPAPPGGVMVDPRLAPFHWKAQANVPHFLDEHTYAFFDVNQIANSPNKTFWPPGTTRAQVETWLVQALEQLRVEHRLGPIGKYWSEPVLLPGTDILVQVGSNPTQFGQFFPISGEGILVYSNQELRLLARLFNR
jgi:hypothetical protein